MCTRYGKVKEYIKQQGKVFEYTLEAIFSARLCVGVCIYTQVLCCVKKVAKRKR